MLTNKNPNAKKLSWAISYAITCAVYIAKCVQNNVDALRRLCITMCTCVCAFATFLQHAIPEAAYILDRFPASLEKWVGETDYVYSKLSNFSLLTSFFSQFHIFTLHLHLSTLVGGFYKFQFPKLSKSALFHILNQRYQHCLQVLTYISRQCFLISFHERLYRTQFQIFQFPMSINNFMKLPAIHHLPALQAKGREMIVGTCSSCKQHQSKNFLFFVGKSFSIS